MFAHYKDCQAWKDAEIPLYTASNNACKMYDATLRQIIVKREDGNIGGLKGSTTKMQQEDPNFVMGNVLCQYMSIGELPLHDEKEASAIQNVQELAKLQWTKLSNMERGHCTALNYLGKRQFHKACEEWENILVEYPKDTLALNMVFNYRLALGEFEELRDAMARVLPFFDKKTEMEYGYICGIYAFGLEETQIYDKAENKAKEALECDKHDAWATHTLAHVYEMTCQYDKGLDFMEKTKPDWEITSSLHCHNNWHRTLYLIEKGDFKSALQLYDEEVGTQLHNPMCNMFNVSDAVSMLYRLKMEGIDVGKERWRDVSEKLDLFVDKHIMGYYDAVVMMGFSGCEDKDRLNSFMNRIRDLASNDDDSDVYRTISSATVHVCRAIQHYDAGEYDEAVEALLPHRYQLYKLGGSRAQRDLFALLMIHAASKSHNYQKLALQLVNERQSLRRTPLTDRLMNNVVKFHDS